MSEEEIIKQLKDSCILDNNCYEVDCLYEKDLEAIRSLLDLYNKEKEKNKKAIKYILKKQSLQYKYALSKIECEELLKLLEEGDK